MKIVSFLGKLAISIFVAAIAITLFSLVLVSMVATVLILHGESGIHILWAVPTMLVVGIGIGGLGVKIHHELFGRHTSLP